MQVERCASGRGLVRGVEQPQDLAAHDDRRDDHRKREAEALGTLTIGSSQQTR